MMLPRLKMISVKDFYWDQKPGKATRKWCPMGQGNVDFKKFWTMVKDAKFTGPVSVQVEYKPEEFGMKDFREAFARDLEFTRKFV